MKFLFLSEDAQPIAMAVAAHYRKLKMNVLLEEAAWSDAPLVTTILAKKAGLSILVEAQAQFNYSATLRTLATALRAQRFYGELYLATGSEAAIPATAMKLMTKEGVGWLVVEEDKAVTTSLPARNWAHVVSPDPTLSLGAWNKKINEALAKFNQVNRKDGLRDLCELLEQEVEETAILAVRRKWLKVPEGEIHKQDLYDQINTLASKDACLPGRKPPVDDAMKTDLHSFRDARNLVDHPVKGVREDRKRALKFHDKMTQGIRLISELESVKNRLKRS